MLAMKPAPEAKPLAEADIAALEALLDRLPPDFEPLDVVMVDGYLCGVLLQPRPLPEPIWLARIIDADGRAPPPSFPIARLAVLLRRRYAELNAVIERREWFDPWVYELDEAASPSEAVLPWVAGFAAAMDAFPELMRRHERDLLEPLATLYRHFDPEDLEDADDLLREIETLEPPRNLPEAVEDLVRSVLLMADVSRPAARPAAAPIRRLARKAAESGSVSQTPDERGPPGPGPRSRSGRRV